MAHEAFVSYATEDQALATRVCGSLETAGVRCWIAPRDVPGGIPWPEALIDAIASCRMLVLVLSEAANASPYVRREVERAVARQVPILTLRVGDVVPAKDLEFLTSLEQRIEGGARPDERLDALSAAARELLARGGTTARRSAGGPAAGARGGTSRRPSAAGSGVPVSWERAPATGTALLLSVAQPAPGTWRWVATDPRRGVLVPQADATVPAQALGNLKRSVADAMSGAPSADPGLLARVGSLLLRLLVPPAVRDLLARTDGPVSLLTDDDHVPWELLHDGRRFLSVARPFARVPASLQWADALFGEDVPADPAGRGALVVADPTGEAPRARAEAEAVRAALERGGVAADVLVGPAECTYIELMGRLDAGGYGIVHVAGPVRGLAERGLSAVVLADEQLVTADEICLAVRGRPLVFVDACASAGAPGDGDRVRTIAQAFAHGNREGRACAVVSSGWWGGGDVAGGVAATFYARLLAGDALGEALRAARARAAEADPASAAWACYALLGEPGVVLRRGPVAGPSPRPAAPRPGAPARGRGPLGSVLDLAAPAPDVPDPSEGPPWSDAARLALMGAVAQQRATASELLESVHVLLGLTYVEGGHLVGALAERGIDAAAARRALRARLSRRDGGAATDGPRAGGVVLSSNVRRCLVSAKSVAEAAGARETGEAHLLLALVALESGGALTVLRALGVDVARLRRALEVATTALADADRPQRPPASGPEPAPASVRPPPTAPLDGSSPPPAVATDDALFRADGLLDRGRFAPEALAALEAALEAAVGGFWDELRSPHLFLGALRRPGSTLAARVASTGRDPVVLDALLVEATKRPPDGGVRRPRLHREFVSDNAIVVLREAARAARAAGRSAVLEDDLVTALVSGAGQFVPRFLAHVGIDPAELAPPPS